MVANVTMKAGMVVLETMIPFSAPTRVPHRIPMRIPTGTGSPTHVIMPALTHPVTAMTEPTDRSMPPKRMTKVMPHARYRLMVI